MSVPVPNDPESEPSAAAPEPAETSHAAVHHDHLDPITGEPHAHPVGVGVGAMGAGAIGAAIGAFAGPIGVVVGAAIGAIAGGLAGKEAAEESDINPTATESGVPLDEFDHAPGAMGGEEIPLSSSLSERVEPADDTFFTGGTVGRHESVAPEDRSNEYDHDPAVPVATSASAVTPERMTPVTASTSDVFADDKPLPTASSGLITPDESSFFADSATGESSVLTESPLPAALAVNAEGTSDDAEEFPAGTGHFDAEHTVRTAAYYRYLDREDKGEQGSEFEDWIKAEQEVSSH